MSWGSFAEDEAESLAACEKALRLSKELEQQAARRAIT